LAQATENKPTIAHTAIHNTLLNPGTLLVGAILVAIGFAFVPLGGLHGNALQELSNGNLGPLAFVLLSGAFVSAGLIMIFTQQYFALALTTTLNNLNVIGIALILYTVAQFLISFGQSLQPAQPFYGVIVTIVGYALVAVYLVLTGQAGMALRSSIAPPPAK
jgi:hypothetical protein